MIRTVDDVPDPEIDHRRYRLPSILRCRLLLRRFGLLSFLLLLLRLAVFRCVLPSRTFRLLGLRCRRRLAHLVTLGGLVRLRRIRRGCRLLLLLLRGFGLALLVRRVFKVECDEGEGWR